MQIITFWAFWLARRAVSGRSIVGARKTNNTQKITHVIVTQGPICESHSACKDLFYCE